MVGNGEFKSRRRSLDSILNLTPFIDILSVCICFLLMSAIWFQIASVPVKQSHGTEGAAAGGYELEVVFSRSTEMIAMLKKQGRAFLKSQLKAKDADELITVLDETLKKWFNPSAGKNKTAIKPSTQVSSAMVTTRKGVTYGDLVATLDVIRSHEIVNLGVVPSGEF